MTRRKSDEPRGDDKHGTLSMAAYERYERRKKAERDLRLAQRDDEYRRALGLDDLADLPKSLGTSGGTRAPMAAGIRGTRRPR